MTQAFAQTLSADTIPQTGAEGDRPDVSGDLFAPDDNKLRLYASLRLDEETYKKVHDAGFRWAPKQGLFVAPAWTPGREDVLPVSRPVISGTKTAHSLTMGNAERFNDYSDKRAGESERELAHVDALASAIPFGQPILVGHHSERRARRDAQKIENGMKRAVMLFERAEYWEERAQPLWHREVQRASGCALPSYQKN
jgi:hypothetical protein